MIGVRFFKGVWLYFKASYAKRMLETGTWTPEQVQKFMGYK